MTRYIAFGDIHGHCTEFLRLYHRINIEKDDVLVFIGDYIDRGPDSKGVVDCLITTRDTNLNQCVFLRGNHEDMYLKGRTDPYWMKMWLQNGGDKAVKSFDMQYPYKDMPVEYQNFFEATKLYYKPNEHLLFVHAGILPGMSIEYQTEEDLLWIREEFLYSKADHGCIVVHGHTPNIDREFEDGIRFKVGIFPNRINVDTGSCFKGSVSAVILDEKGNVLETHSEKCS